MAEQQKERPEGTTERAGQKDEGQPTRRSFWRHPATIAGVAGLVGFVVYWGVGYLVYSFNHESTNDAFLEANVVSIAPQVSGKVNAVHVTDNQHVKKGDVLIEIDPRDYQAKVNQKQALVHVAEANVKSAEVAAQVAQTRVTTARQNASAAAAEVRAAQATAQLANEELKRNRQLREQHTISAQEFDRFRTAAESANAKLTAAQQNAAAANSAVTQAQQQLDAAQTQLQAAKAQVEQDRAELESARLDLSHTKIFAPTDGKVTHKQVEPGSYLQVGQSIFALVPPALWVVANYKETQLKNMRKGQSAMIKIDAYPAHAYPAQVNSFQAGSGARFSLLPPENAVGNYVKVVQRVPVKIVFNEALPPELEVGPGMSVVPEVQIKQFAMADWMRMLIGVGVAVLGGAILWALARRKEQRR